MKNTIRLGWALIFTGVLMQIAVNLSADNADPGAPQGSVELEKTILYCFQKFGFEPHEDGPWSTDHPWGFVDEDYAELWVTARFDADIPPVGDPCRQVVINHLRWRAHGRAKLNRHRWWMWHNGWLGADERVADGARQIEAERGTVEALQVARNWMPLAANYVHPDWLSMGEMKTNLDPSVPIDPRYTSMIYWMDAWRAELPTVIERYCSTGAPTFAGEGFEPAKRDPYPTRPGLLPRMPR